MSFLAKILSPMTGGFIKAVGDVIDNLHTSSEEKAEKKLELKKMILAHEAMLEKTLQTELQAKERIIVAEMKQGDNFTKRARPAVVYTFVLTILIAVIRSAITGEPPVILEQIPTELWKLWTAVMGVWMVGRTAEKMGANGVFGKITSKVTGSKSGLFD